MRRTYGQGDNEEIKEIWQGIALWMVIKGITPQELAKRTQYPQNLIERGIRGEPEPIRHKVGDFAEALNLSSSREGRFCEETLDSLPYEEIVRLLTSPLRTHRKKFWD